VSLVSLAQLVEQFTTLEELAPGRVLAGLGTGDDMSKPEHVAYGIAYPSVSEREQRLREAAQSLAAIMPVWIGAGSRATNAVARDCGVALNVWGVPASTVREESARGPVTWAGPLGEDVSSTLSDLQDAGATWVVAGTPAPIDALQEWRHTH
jgi:hypothetical protein